MGNPVSTQMTSPTEIIMEGVTKDYQLRGRQTIRAVESLHLAVQPGEFVALIGPSGCGKSTVLRLMAGLEDPTEGHVLISGHPPGELTRSHRLSVAFQDHALLPWLTVTNNIALPFKLAGRPVSHSRIAELIALMGIKGFERARPRQLSGGMRQRVNLARALALQPDVLLLDEPFGSLDAVTRRRLNLELERIWYELETTTVLVTHSVDEAAFLADRVVVLSERPGRISFIRDVSFRRPRSKDIMNTTMFREIVEELFVYLDAQEEG